MSAPSAIQALKENRRKDVVGRFYVEIDELLLIGESIENIQILLNKHMLLCLFFLPPIHLGWHRRWRTRRMPWLPTAPLTSSPSPEQRPPTRALERFCSPSNLSQLAKNMKKKAHAVAADGAGDPINMRNSAANASLATLAQNAESPAQDLRQGQEAQDRCRGLCCYYGGVLAAKPLQT